MNTRVDVLKQLVRNEHYVFDEGAVAEAIVLRSLAKRALPEVAFRGTPQPEPAKVRSFRPHRGARSFRLSIGERRPTHARPVKLRLLA